MANLRELMERMRTKPMLQRPTQPTMQPTIFARPLGSQGSAPPMRPRAAEFMTNQPMPPDQVQPGPTRGAGFRQAFQDSGMFGAQKPRMSMRDILMSGARRARIR